MKRAVAVVVGAAVATIALTSCEVNQIDWRNHFYAVSGASCLGNAATTVRNGTGVSNGVRIDVLKTVYGDFTHDGVQDVAVVLGCSSALGGNQAGSEIQVFTRDGRPVQRLVPPSSASQGGAFAPAFSLDNIFNYNFAPGAGDNLTTGVVVWAPGDAHCCPSISTVYRWVWTGAVFYPIVNNLGTD